MLSTEFEREFAFPATGPGCEERNARAVPTVFSWRPDSWKKRSGSHSSENPTAGVGTPLVVLFSVGNTGEEHPMDQQRQDPAQGQVQIKADEKELMGLYSNLVM